MDVNEIFHIPAVSSEQAKQDLGKKRKLAGPTQADLDRVKEKIAAAASTGPAQQHGPTFAMPLPKKRREHVPVQDGAWQAEEAKLSAEQRQLLNMLDHQDDGTAQQSKSGSTDLAKKLLANVTKQMQTNTRARLKHADNPKGFMESETELSIAIRELLTLSGSPEALKGIVDVNGVPDLMHLLAHENSEIALSLLDVLREWTEEDVEKEVTGETQAAKAALSLFIDAIFGADFLQYALALRSRLASEAAASSDDTDATQDLDRCDFTLLSIFNNISEIESPKYTDFMLMQSPDLLQWVLDQITKTSVTSTSQSAAEFLEIALVTSEAFRTTFAEERYMEPILKVLARYRKKDPSGLEAEEFCDNIWNILCSVLSTDKGKAVFAALEGPALLHVCLKNEKRARIQAMRALNYSCTHLNMTQPAAKLNCEQFVDCGGLGHFFTIFSKAFAPPSPKSKQWRKTYKGVYHEKEDQEHALAILQSLLWHLDDAAPVYRQTRLVQKCFEHGGERLEQLVSSFRSHTERLARVDAAITAEKEEYEEVDAELEQDWELQRLEGGLSNIFAIVLILAQLFITETMEDAPAILLGYLDDHGVAVSSVTSFLEEYIAGMDTATLQDEKEKLSAIRSIFALHQ